MTDRVTALLLTVVALGCAAAYFLLYPHVPADLAQQFTPEHVQLLRMFDTTHQQAAHRVLLLALLVAVVIGTQVARTMRDRRGYQRCATALIRYSGIAFLALTLVTLYPYFRELPKTNIGHLQGGRYALAFVPTLATYLYAVAGSFAILALCGWSVRKFHPRKLSVAAAAIGGVYFLVFFIAPCLLSPNFAGFRPDLITGIEWHYSGQLGPGDRLAAGHKLFDDVRVYSGYLPTLALALVESWLGYADFAGHVRIVQFTQIVFLGLTLYAYRQWRPRDPLFLVLAVLLVAPWISTLHAAVFYPNQSAWRALAFPLGIVALLHLRGKPPLWRPFHLGAFLGLLVLLNTEMGICVTAGFIAFQLGRIPRNEISRIPAFLTLTTAGAIVSFAFWILAFRLGLGYWPVPASAEQLVLLIRRFTAGYGGSQLRVVEPAAFLILCHSAFLVVFYGIRWWTRPLGSRSSARLAIACMITLWFAYYAKAPQSWNLWTLLFLYSFLLSSMVRWSYFRSLSFGYRRLAGDWRMMALCLIVLPAMIFSNLLQARSAQRVFVTAPKHDDAATREVSGIRLSGDHADLLLEKAGYAREAHRMYGSRTIFLTANSYTMPLLTGHYPLLPFQDPFTETITHGDYEMLKERITRAAPAVILVDEPGSLLSGYPEQQAFFARLMRDLSGLYQRADSGHGWEIWRRRGLQGP